METHNTYNNIVLVYLPIIFSGEFNWYWSNMLFI